MLSPDYHHPLHERVEAALASMRGYLQSDGGDVRLVRITDEHVAELELMGACSACSMSTMTLRAGLEEVIKRMAPEIERVVAVDVS
jgi:Fe-S cluster biogenesis protein NfuA